MILDGSWSWKHLVYLLSSRKRIKRRAPSLSLKILSGCCLTFVSQNTAARESVKGILYLGIRPL